MKRKEEKEMIDNKVIGIVNIGWHIFLKHFGTYAAIASSL